MGISSDHPSDDPKHNIVMGFPPAASHYPAPSHHQECSPSSFQPYHHAYAPAPYHQFPHEYPSSSLIQPHHGCETSPFQIDANCMNTNLTHPYSQPYNDYYYHQHYNSLVQESGSRASFGRVMLILMIFLVASMCMMSLVMWFHFGTYIPQFQVTSIKVSNFTATNTTLTSFWNVDISVSNINKELDIQFDRGMSSIFYKDNLLGVSTLRPFDLEKLQQYDLNFSIPGEKRADDQKFQNWVLNALAQDRNSGLVVISLRLAIEANFFTTSNAVYRRENLSVFCEDIQISFSPSTSQGTLSPGLGNSCLIRLQDSLH